MILVLFHSFERAWAIVPRVVPDPAQEPKIELLRAAWAHIGSALPSPHEPPLDDPTEAEDSREIQEDHGVCECEAEPQRLAKAVVPVDDPGISLDQIFEQAHLFALCDHYPAGLPEQGVQVIDRQVQARAQLLCQG